MRRLHERHPALGRQGVEPERGGAMHSGGHQPSAPEQGTGHRQNYLLYFKKYLLKES